LRDIVALLLQRQSNGGMMMSTRLSWIWKQEMKQEQSTLSTDDNHLRAKDITVKESKLTRHYGMCGTVSSLDKCIIPASNETNWDTAQDDRVWQPTESLRGEICKSSAVHGLAISDIEAHRL
jgi:hypothetical protein